MEEMAKMASLSGRPAKGRRADWLTELVWKRSLQLTVLYPRDMLLDIAGEDGEFLRRIGQGKHDVGLAGICATPQLARTARYRVPEADIMYAELDDFPWLNQSFDVVFSLHSVPLLRDPQAVLSEVLRVLKPGGQFVMAAPWLPKPLRILANRWLVDDSKDSAPIPSKAELVTCLEDAGFERVAWLRLAGMRSILVGWRP